MVENKNNKINLYTDPDKDKFVYIKLLKIKLYGIKLK